jgi:ssDNA-binding Zn-finger/Zn-ribbon topoisomerase 1
VFPDAATVKAAPDAQGDAPRGRQKISEAGARTETGQLVCPKCGGAQFTAKRSKKGKVIGFTTLGVAGLVAPKSQVKCVTCGTMYKRG